jgi:hypothetical protein
MPSSFLPNIATNTLTEFSGNDEAFFSLLVEPLHEELYKRRTFDFMDELSEGQQLLLSFDYVRMQVGQGGFIQLIQNGYIGLLISMPEWLYMVHAPEMAKNIDDVIKVYVLNRELLDKQTTVEEFAKLYDELKEFEILDSQFQELHDETLHLMVAYAQTHMSEFASLQ